MGSELGLHYGDEFDVHSHPRMNLRGMGRVGSNYSLVYVLEIRITFMLMI